MPPDLVAALAPHPEARSFLDGLSRSRRQWFADHVGSAKKPETRTRRLDEVVAMLRQGRAQR